MVKIGFVVEGYSEAILIKAESFKNYLNGLGLETTNELVINAVGKNNLYHPDGNFIKLKEQVDGWLNTLYDLGAEVVFILLDRDNDDVRFTQFKSKVYRHPGNIVIVAMHALEAWFLADTLAMSLMLETNIEEIQNPESFILSLEEISRFKQLYLNQRIADKKILAKKMNHCNFSLAKAAAHPTCPSAAYFHRKLSEAAMKGQ